MEFIKKIRENNKLFPNKINEDSYDIQQKNTKMSNAEYFDIIDPNTGVRYDIPMLASTDPDYFHSYIYYMKIRERSPETFERILNWE